MRNFKSVRTSKGNYSQVLLGVQRVHGVQQLQQDPGDQQVQVVQGVQWVQQVPSMKKKEHCHSFTQLEVVKFFLFI